MTAASPGVGAEIGSSSRNDPQVLDMSQPEGGKGYFSEFTHAGIGSPHTNTHVFQANTLVILFFDCGAQLVVSLLPNQGLNLCPLQWKFGVLPVGLPGNSC